MKGFNAEDYPEMITKVFDLLLYAVESSGGDGGGTVICHYYDYKSVAKAFEQCWKDRHLSKKIERFESDNSIYFVYDQEGYRFIDNEDKIHPYDDITIKI